MKKMFLAFALLLGAAPLCAQTMTVSGSHVQDAAGNACANCSITFAPADLTGRPISFRIGGAGGQVISRAVSAYVTNGAFSISLPDVSQTNPVNVCFKTTITDLNTGQSVLGAGYTCVQPGSAIGGWCGSTTCNFDNYVPNTPGLPLQIHLALTTIGTTGGATWNGTTLNVPQYGGGSGSGGGVVLIVVAASNSVNKVSANYVATGTNDQNTINAAIAACPATLPASQGPAQCTISLMPGVYNVSGKVVIDSDDITLTGQGWCMWGGYWHPWSGTGSPNGAIGTGCAQLRATTGGFSLISIEHNNQGGPGGDPGRHRGIQIKDLYLVGFNYLNQGIMSVGNPNSGCAGYTVGRGTFGSVTIDGCLDDNSSITDNIIQRMNVGIGVQLDTPEVHGNSIQDNNGVAEAICGVHARVYDELVFDDQGTLMIGCSIGGKYTGNVFGNTYGDGIHQYLNDATITANEFTGIVGSAIYVDGTAQSTITGNAIDYSSDQYGFSTNGQQNGSTSDAIHVTVTAADVTVTGNTFRSDANIVGYAINDLATTGSVSGNTATGTWRHGLSGGPFYFLTPNSQPVASGSTALATGSIGSGACQAVTPGSVNSTASSDVLAGDLINFTPFGSLAGVTGYGAGGLATRSYASAGFVNFDVCNPSGSPVTPGAATLNWSVLRGPQSSAPPSPATYASNGCNFTTPSASSISCTVTGMTAGQTVLAWVSGGSSSISLTDTGTSSSLNTIISASSGAWASGNLAMFDVVNAGLGTHIFTANFGGTVSFPAMTVVVLNGASTSSPIDSVATTAFGTSNALTCNNVTTSYAGELLVAEGVLAAGSAITAGTSPQTMTLAQASSNVSAEYGNGAGTTHATFGAPVTAAWVCQVVAIH